MRHLRRQTRPSPVPRQAAPEGVPRPSGTRTPFSARPCRPRGACNLARPRGGPGGAAAPQARPPPGRASREAANMAPSVTQPPRPPSPPATRTSAPSGRGPGGRAAQSLLFHPPSSPWPRGPAGAKELMPARSLPPPRLPPAFPVPVRAASSAFPAPRPEPGGPQVATITCKSSGARAPEGFCLQLLGSGSSAPGGSSSSCPCFPRPPSPNLTFRGGGGGGRGDPACAARAVGGRRLEEAAWSREVCGRAGERSPRSQVTRGSGEKPWREKGAGARLWPHYRRPRPRPRTALKPATRRGGCSAPLGPARRHSAREPGLQRGLGRRTEGGAGPALSSARTAAPPPGPRAPPGPRVARGLADVRPSGAGTPAPTPHPRAPVGLWTGFASRLPGSPGPNFA